MKRHREHDDVDSYYDPEPSWMPRRVNVIGTTVTLLAIGLFVAGLIFLVLEFE